MNVEIGTEAAQFPEKEYINVIFFAVCFKVYDVGLTFGTEKAMGRNPRLVPRNSQPDNPRNVQFTLIQYY
jgi:hypothetical protein